MSAGFTEGGRYDGVYGGSSRATTLCASRVIDDSDTGLGDADDDGAGLTMEAESGAELADSESRADVAPKAKSAGVAAAMKSERRKLMEEAEAAAAPHVGDKAQRSGGLKGHDQVLCRYDLFRGWRSIPGGGLQEWCSRVRELDQKVRPRGRPGAT